MSPLATRLLHEATLRTTTIPGEHRRQMRRRFCMAISDVLRGAVGSA
jgi:hypothetical protein